MSNPNTILIDKLIGNVYPTIKLVAQNINDIKAIANSIDSINGINSNNVNYTALYQNLDSVIFINDNKLGLLSLINNFEEFSDSLNDGLILLGQISNVRDEVNADALQVAADKLVTNDNAAISINAVNVTSANLVSSNISKDEANASAIVASNAAAGAVATKALMDTALTNVTDYSNTLAQLSPAAKEIVAAADVADIFIYDTTLDSDGGAWRKRCNWTSWMKETLGTSSRGSRNQFPQKALIVARAGGAGKVIIYDLDQASCPMWMEFLPGGTRAIFSVGHSSVSAMNGLIYVGQNGTGALNIVDFVSDITAIRIDNTVNYYPRPIGQRNDAVAASIASFWSAGIVNRTVNEIATTVLPGTPVDRVRKLPTPTVAVATAGGVSVIHWDGRVANSAWTQVIPKVAFAADGTLWHTSTANAAILFSPSREYAVTGFATRYYSSPTTPDVTNFAATNLLPAGKRVVKGSANALVLLSHEERSGFLGGAQYNSSAVAYLTSKYNTGYQVGATKLALAESTADLTSLVQGATDFDGTELIVPGTWSMSTLGTATATESPNGQLNLTGDGSAKSARGDISFDTVVGRTYRLSLTVAGQSVGVDVGPTQGSTSIINGSGVAVGTATLSFVATSTTTWVRIWRSSASLATVTGLSCKYRVTTVLYDDFGGYADTAAMLAAGYSALAGGTLALDSGRIRVTNSGAINTAALKTVTGLVVGQRYKLTANWTKDSSNGYMMTTFGGYVNYNSSGVKTTYFVATATSCTLQFGNDGSISGGSSLYDDIRVDVVASDRSVAGNHPVVYGTVTRTAVATGAELAAYGGFSASNYLEVPYTSALDVGTGDFHYGGWVSFTGTATQEIFRRSDAAFAGAYARVYTASGSLVGRTGTVTLTGTKLINDGLFHRFDLVRRAGVLELWIDGERHLTGADVASNTNASATVTIGVRQGGGDPFTAGKVALFRTSTTAPTPQQIRDMYAAEAQLFQPNAKCLLPADSVSALAYDDSTELLHVATTSGMARLKDLLVVSKDAIVVTGIDARSGIVVTRDSGSADAQLPSVLLREELLAPQPVALYDRDKAKGSGVTTNATPTVIGRIPFEKGECKIVDVRVRANQYADGTAYGRYVRRALVDRPEEGNIALGGSVEVMGTDAEGTSTQDIDLTVNTTTQTLDITATGLASTNIEWNWEAMLS